MRPYMREVEGMTAPDESGERAIPPSQGSAGSAPRCLVRDARARMTDDEFWEDVFIAATGNWWLIYDRNLPYDPEDDVEDLPETHQLNKPCTECGEFICGYDHEGRPMYHRQREEDD